MNGEFEMRGDFGMYKVKRPKLGGLPGFHFGLALPDNSIVDFGYETFAQTVHSKTSYDKTDIVWGARFGDMYLADTAHVAIDRHPAQQGCGIMCNTHAPFNRRVVEFASLLAPAITW